MPSRSQVFLRALIDFPSSGISHPITLWMQGAWACWHCLRAPQTQQVGKNSQAGGRQDSSSGQGACLGPAQPWEHPRQVTSVNTPSPPGFQWCPKQHHFPGGEHPAGPQALTTAGLRDAAAQPGLAFWEWLSLPGLSPGHTCSALGFPRRSPNAKLDLCTRQHLFLVRVTLETFPSAQLSEPDCIFL